MIQVGFSRVGFKADPQGNHILSLIMESSTG